MKTSNKILLGFALLFLIVQSTCLVVGHNYSTKKSMERRTEVNYWKKVSLEGEFSYLVLESPVNLSISQQKNVLSADIHQHPDSTQIDLRFNIQNDTCFVAYNREDFAYNKSLRMTLPDLKGLKMIRCEVKLDGTYDSLTIDNAYGPLYMNTNSSANYINLISKDVAENRLYKVKQLDVESENSKVVVHEGMDFVKAKLQQKSKLHLKLPPQSFQLEKDPSSDLKVGN